MRKILLLTVLVLLIIPIVSAKEQTITVPAIKETEFGFEGTLATISLKMEKGTGHVYVDTQPLTQIDTQSSTRLAKEVVSNTLDTNMDIYDLFYTIRSKSPIVGGPSAGAAITVLTLATTLNLTINNNIIMTGTINPDGSIGPVGAIFEKARTASDLNITTFLIPQGQSIIKTVEQKKTEMPGIIHITSTPASIDIDEYAKKQWNLEVKEIGNVKQAIKYMTAYQFKEPKIDKVDENMKIKKIMKNMASNFLEAVNNKYENAKKVLSQTRAPYIYVQEFQSLIKKYKETLDNSKALFDQRDYYSSSSKAFVASIHFTYIKEALNTIDSEKTKPHVSNLIDDIEDNIQRVSTQISNKQINHITDVEIISASKERINSAKTRLEKGKKAYYNYNYMDAVYHLAYAKERANTALVWLNLSNSFTSRDFTFNMESLKTLAQRRVEDAASSIIYAQAVGIPIEEPQKLLDTAKLNLNNELYAPALSYAIMARSLADLAMETRRVTEKQLEEKIKNYDNTALTSIQQAQNNNATPILAISYYEYAQSFEKDKKSNIIYLKYAKNFATLSKDLSSLPLGKDNNIVTKKENYLQPAKKSQQDTNTIIYAGIVCFFIGAVIGNKGVKRILKKR